MGIGLIWSLVTSRLGGWLIGGLVVLAVLGLLKWEHNAKLKAQGQLATAQTAAAISQQQLLLYQEREEIQGKAQKKRGKLNELQRKNDLDGLADDFNAPNGVRRARPANPPGGVKAPARYKDAGGTGPEYEEAH